uniref:Glycosyltransferase n=1 Tax=Thermorudis peleae TaxID=1382356 RepID=A0A831TF15_9BACT
MSGMSQPAVSLILTVKDEAASLPELLASIAAQSRPPDEVIVVDGGSCDATVTILRQWAERLPLTVIELPGASIAEGRNAALEQARGELVAVTDAGVILEPDWLERLIEPFLAPEREQPDVVSGFFRAAPRTLFELALGVTTLPDVEEIREERFLPSSRSVAFRRSWFLAGIRYPGWLDYCEDVVFDLRLRRAGARFRFQPAAIAWFRPRRTLAEFWRQYYRYARGDGKAGLFTTRHLIRYATYLGLVPAVLLTRDRRLALLAGLGALAYLRRPLWRLWRRREVGPRRLVVAALLVPLIRLVGDLAKMAGYPAGLAWRARRYGLRRTWRSIPEPVSLGRAGEPAAGVQAGGTPLPRD